MSKFKDAIKAAKGGETRKLSSNKATNKEIKKSTSKEVKKYINTEKVNEKMVGINIKVPESHRQHWAVESKKARSTITADIVEALNKKYGTP